jgi:plastocyanin
MPNHPFYHVRPILHEPGPISVSGFISSQGFPVAKGDPIKLTAEYDNTRPHTRVMGISMVYVAPSDQPVNGCGPLPADGRPIVTPLAHRTAPPKFTVPIVGIGSDGIAHDISKPPGRAVLLRSGSKVRVRNFYFGRPNIVVARGAKLNWDIGATNNELHNVTVASGPRGFGSPNRAAGTFSYRFAKRGKYRIFCALHPVLMTEVVTVR